ncbi:hypothetical protein G7Z17_g4710 [Cylindrodendrum hubeiense]|uniref:GED domain-containing protein n=1 Tax=Cylindrodendrum hubeiense TaxID=595255 RepID=A0A9P5HDC6_9HYPO|nr:hypothetical protein G7Z17_g4710 [Cylindrodendrum hubeiense]
MVDLPGLIHSENKHQSEFDVDLIREVVQGYMKNPRTIILAVVSAKYEFANQVVLKLARVSDPKGSRTLGVITKPDTLRQGSKSEDSYISLAENHEIEFRIGWHVLRNADSEDDPLNLLQRDEQEAQFFSHGAWASLSHSTLGVKTLRERLSKLLFNQIAAALPTLIEEIRSKSEHCREQLAKLGPPRTSLEDQKLYLFQVSHSLQSLIKSAIDGTYIDPFFGDAMSPSGYQKRLRAVVQNLSHEFATELGSGGHRYEIALSPKKVNKNTGAEPFTREEFVDKIMKLMERSRGRELPGLFNPMIVSDLFKEQSSPWAEITRIHVNKVWSAAREFLKHLTTHVSDPSVVNRMMEIVVEPKLDAFHVSLKEKTAGLLKQHQEFHPITYNGSFTETVNRVRLERQKSSIDHMMISFFGDTPRKIGTPVSTVVDVGSLHNQLLKLIETDMSHQNAASALDYVVAYYDIALKRFIDDVSIEVIENILISELGNILEPFTIAMMSEAKVNQIAGETDESRAARETAKRQLSTLENGLEICRRHLGSQVLDISEDEVERLLDEDEKPPNRDEKHLTGPYDTVDELKTVGHGDVDFFGNILKSNFHKCFSSHPPWEYDVPNNCKVSRVARFWSENHGHAAPKQNPDLVSRVYGAFQCYGSKSASLRPYQQYVA